MISKETFDLWASVGNEIAVASMRVLERYRLIRNEVMREMVSEVLEFRRVESASYLYDPDWENGLRTEWREEIAANKAKDLADKKAKESQIVDTEKQLLRKLREKYPNE